MLKRIDLSPYISEKTTFRLDIKRFYLVPTYTRPFRYLNLNNRLEI